MNRIVENLANVLGSVGIAALAVAILLVPYSDLNASVSSTTPCSVMTCAGEWELPGPTCTYSGTCTPSGCTICSGPKKPIVFNGGFFCPSICPGSVPG